MDSPVEITVRQLKKSDFGQLAALCVEEGWNSSVEYVEMCFSSNPTGCFMAEDQHGTMISHCGTSKIDDHTGVLNMYITKKEHRGKGIGKKVYKKALEVLEGKNIQINSMWYVIDMYKATGFNVCSFEIHYFMCKREYIKSTDYFDFTDDLQLVPLKEIDFEKIVDYDESIYPVKRCETIKAHIKLSSFGIVAFRDGKILGWGALTNKAVAYSMMPIYAETPDVAKSIVHSLIQCIPPDGIVEFSYAASNTNARTLFDGLGMTKDISNRGMRMYSLRDITLPLEKIYSLMNFHTVLA